MEYLGQLVGIALMVAAILVPIYSFKWYDNKRRLEFYNKFEIGKVYRYYYLRRSNPFYEEGGSKYYKVVDKRDGYIKFVRLRTADDTEGSSTDYESLATLFYDRDHWDV